MIPIKQIRRPVGGEITPRRAAHVRPIARSSKPLAAKYAPSHNVTWVKREFQPPKPTAKPRIAAVAPPQQSAVTPAAKKAPVPVQAPKKEFTSPAPTAKKSRLWQSLQIPLIILGGLALGILAQSAIVGQTLIIAYGAIAYLRRIESRVTFTLAILTIVTTILLIVMQNNSQLSQAFAGYTFLFLLIGIICAFRESHEEGKLLSKKRGVFRLRQAKSSRT